MSKLIALDGKTPRLGSRVFVADGAVLVGDVEVGDDSSVFYNAVLRGDLAPIRIGKVHRARNLHVNDRPER